MKTPLLNKLLKRECLKRSSGILAVLLAHLGLASAQTPTKLDIQLYAGLSITGAVGTVYSIEYVTDLAQTNNASAWRCLEFLQLPASPYLWADKSAPATGRRFYRAVQIASADEHGVHPAGHVPDGQPDERSGPRSAMKVRRRR